mgnify:CR=1 FL=1
MGAQRYEKGVIVTNILWADVWLMSGIKKEKPQFLGALVRMKGLEPPRLTALDPKSSAATNYATSAKFEVAKIGVFLLPPNFITTFFLCNLFFFLLNVKFLYQKRSNVFTLFSIPKYSCTFKNVGIFVFFCHFSNGSLNFIGNCQH